MRREIVDEVVRWEREVGRGGHRYVLGVERVAPEPEHLGGVPELPYREVDVERPVLRDGLMDLVAFVVAELVVFGACGYTTGV
jgi:hypothetical protein